MGDNACGAFVAKVLGIQSVDNKTRFLLEDFFYNEGWTSKTNPKTMKDGFHQQFTYNKSTIAHFIDDFVRLFKVEFEAEAKKILEAKKR